MSGAGRLLGLALIVNLFSSTQTQTEARVSCVFKKSCVLPCVFSRVARIPRSSSLQIYWDRISPEFSPVYSFSFHIHHKHVVYHVLQHTNPYNGRAQLFPQQLQQGNASLLLTRVLIQDQGLYRCLLKSGRRLLKSSWVDVKVQAPVSKVLLEEDGPVVKCVSKDVFPKPSVSWRPPSDHSLSVTSSRSGLFSVTSSVKITQSNDEYSCNISTEHSWRSATYRRNPDVQSSESEVTLLCPDSNSSLTNPSRVWKFNQSETIVTQTRNRTVYSEAWRPFVVGVSEFGNLTLKGVGKDQMGLYSCELTSGRKILSVRTRLDDSVRNQPGASGLRSAVLAGVFAAIGLILAAGFLTFCICKHKKILEKSNSTPKSRSDESTNPAPPENNELLGREA